MCHLTIKALKVKLFNILLCDTFREAIHSSYGVASYFFFLKKKKKSHMGILPERISMYHVHACCLQWLEGIGFLRIEITNGCEALCRC